MVSIITVKLIDRCDGQISMKLYDKVDKYHTLITWKKDHTFERFSVSFIFFFLGISYLIWKKILDFSLSSISLESEPK